MTECRFPVRKHRQLVVLMLAAFSMTAVAPNCRGESSIVPNQSAARLATELVARFDSPVAITSAADGSGRLFVTEQEGTVRIVSGTSVLQRPFLDIRNLVLAGGERGLLSIAFHPDYPDNGFFFVNYTDRPGGHTVVARYSVSPSDPNVADSTSAQLIIRILQPFSNHNGGQLQFGPDGYLYIGMGDGGSGGDPDNRAQNLLDLLGKILRLDVDRGLPHTIPADNPFLNRNDARPEIWASGLRNPWRFSFDRQSGDLFIGDVGQNAFEEIDFQPASSRGGENYGWRRMEGLHCFNPSTNCNQGNLVLPILENAQAEGSCSVTGGYRYRGRFSALQGLYIYGDYCSGKIWGASQQSDGRWTTTLLLQTSMNISTFGEDESGELYVADLGGNVHRLIDPSAKRRRAARR